MTIQPDARGKVYRRTTDGVVDYITVREALDTVDALMMGDMPEVDTMSSTQGHHAIKYTSGVLVALVEVDAADMPAEEPPVVRTVTAKGKTYMVGKVIPAQTERRPLGKNSYSLPHPAYVLYYSERAGKAFGPTRTGSADSKPGTVGRAVWDAVSMPAGEEPGAWTVASHRMLIHRFTEATEDGRAVCNKGYRPWRYGNGYSFKTRAEVEASEYRDLYTVCPRCEAKS